MIHIGIDAHNLEGSRTGVGRYLENVLAEFTKMPGIEDKVRFTLYFKKKAAADDIFSHKIFALRSLEIKPRSSFFLYFLFLLPFRAWRDKVDVMWFPGYMVPYTWRGRSVVVLHDIMFERHPEVFPLRYRVPYRLFARFGARRSERILTVSEFSKKEIQELYNVLPEKISVTPLGIDPRIHVISDEGQLRKVKEKYGISEDFLLYVGQIFQRRHVPEMMKAYTRIARKYPRLQLLVIGKNRTQPFIDIESLVQKLNRQLRKEAILRSDFVPDEDLVALYNAAQVGFYLSDYEGFGMPPLEFLACGTPVLAPDTTSLASTLNGRQVVIKDPSDVDEIADKLKKVLDDKSYMQHIKIIGPGYASQFTWEKCAKQTIDAFLNLRK